MRWRNEGREVAATIVSEGETHYSDQDYELGFDGDRLATSSLLSASFDTVEVLVNPVDSQRLATRWDLSVEIGLAIGDGAEVRNRGQRPLDVIAHILRDAD